MMAVTGGARDGSGGRTPPSRGAMGGGRKRKNGGGGGSASAGTPSRGGKGGRCGCTSPSVITNIILQIKVENNIPAQQRRTAGAHYFALLRHARAAGAVEPALASPAALARPQVAAHVHVGRLVRLAGQAGRLRDDVGRAGRGDAAPALLGLARTFPLAPGGLVAPPPPHHALANDFARYVRPLPLGGGDGRTRASRVDRDDRLLLQRLLRQRLLRQEVLRRELLRRELLRREVGGHERPPVHPGELPPPGPAARPVEHLLAPAPVRPAVVRHVSIHVVLDLADGKRVEGV